MAALSFALLGACSDRAPDRTQVLAQSSRLVKPLPGLYRSTTSLTDFELAGADPRTADSMRDKFAQIMPQTREFCLTPAAAAGGFEEMLKETQQGNCTIESFAADAARLTARMRCRSGASLASTVTVEGTGAADRSHVDLTIIQSGPSIPGGSEKLTMAVDNRRIGDCAAGKP